MKSLKIVAISIGMGIALCSSIFVSNSSDQSIKSNVHSADGFAVLELFSSQGCSSCPAAEALLERIQKTVTNKPVYILSYHVDYWNHLGWKDVFSRAEFTERQYEYSKYFSGQVYTPQLIINGNTEFVGSDSIAIRKMLNNSLAISSFTRLVLQARKLSTGVEIMYQIYGNTDKHQLIIALVKKNSQTNVKHGENEGRTLTHVQVVDRLYSFNLAPAGNGVINILNEFNNEDWEIVGMLQDSVTGPIDAATRASFLDE